jgi:hypothetical protein
MNHNLKELHDAFRAFGETIGPDNAAVWFWKRPYDPSTFTENLDVERSSKFCRAFGLQPSQGPYVFVTSTYPDETNLPTHLPPNSAYFALGDMQSPKISELLSHLADELVKGGPVNPNSAAENVQPTGTWVRLLVAAQRTLKGFGCAWTFKMQAEGIEAQLHPCGS